MKKIRNRIAEVKMMHICLKSGWHWLDVVYVLTGKAF
jgi:D-alanyl-lipoteichoic acid acyltransferase DltB (MBOAT superfamily)